MTPSAERVVGLGLHCMFGCTVRAVEGVGTSSKPGGQSVWFQTEIANVFEVFRAACEVCV